MKKIAIMLPCCNESDLIEEFNELLVSCIWDSQFLFDIIYVNDGSIDNTVQKINNLTCSAKNVNIILLNLHFNVGHQLAIYKGLLYVYDLKYDNILVMDSDGENDPRAILDILDHSECDIVQVIRGKRSESFSFKLCYSIYKLLFYILIGKKNWLR